MQPTKQAVFFGVVRKRDGALLTIPFRSRKDADHYQQRVYKASGAVIELVGEVPIGNVFDAPLSTKQLAYIAYCAGWLAGRGRGTTVDSSIEPFAQLREEIEAEIQRHWEYTERGDG